MRTGYFATPGKRTDYNRKVHIVYSEGDNVPLCGTKFGDGAEFQWCYNGVALHMVTCKACAKIALAKNL
jgi:hypothetical protein